MKEKEVPVVRWLKATEMARSLGVSKMTVYRLMHDGTLKTQKVRGQYRVAEGEFFRFIKDSAYVPDGNRLI
jgi:excisionase family DNA binding protein